MSKPRKYTEEIHIDRLTTMLSGNRTICDSCPAARYYSGNNSCVEPWTNNPCRICAEFVGLEHNGGLSCPCMRLGDEEAYNTTIKKLEEIGIKL